MKIEKIYPDQIITLNDYPVHSDKVLAEYFEKSKLGKELPFIPVIKKSLVKPYLTNKLSEIFKKFEKINPDAKYFMLDGSHRTTALTLTKQKINVILCEKNQDIDEAKKLVIKGQVIKNTVLDYTIEKNCKILNDHFNKKPYFMTVKQKTVKMIKEKTIPDNMINYYNKIK